MIPLGLVGITTEGEGKGNNVDKGEGNDNHDKGEGLSMITKNTTNKYSKPTASSVGAKSKLAESANAITAGRGKVSFMYMYLVIDPDAEIRGDDHAVVRIGQNGLYIWYILVPLFLSIFLDVHMTSPPTSPSRNLQGASRTTGGFSRGRAMGNTFNYADASDIQMDLDLALSIPAKVYLYESLNNSSQVDPTKVKPHRILKIDVSNTLAPVLTKLA